MAAVRENVRSHIRSASVSAATGAARMGAQGRSRVINEFTWARVATRIQDILCGRTAPR